MKNKDSATVEMLIASAQVNLQAMQGPQNTLATQAAATYALAQAVTAIAIMMQDQVVEEDE